MNAFKDLSTDARLNYIANCELGECTPELAGQASGAPAVIDEIAKGVVVENNLLAFTPGVSSEVRQDVMDSFLFATLVANRAADPESQNKAWFAKYNEVLSHLGWVPAEIKYYEANAGGQSFVMDRIVLDMLSSGLAAAALPGPASTLMLGVASKMINKLRKDEQPLRLFESRSSSQQGANFQVGACNESEEGDVNVVIGSVNFSSSSHMTRVLFAQWSSGQAQVYGGGYNLRLNRRHFESVQEKVREKLTADSRRNIDEFDI